ncbi:MAG: transporter substrate-binding domain-containing protein [Sulfurospirillum sp.]|nr:transporter substrate-binding domain-containing protein [Sulfurospirillum sp.]
MHKILFFTLFFPFCILFSKDIFFTEQQQVWIDTHKTIFLSNELDWYPYDFNDKNEPKGYIVDFMDLVFKKIGIKRVYKTAPWPELQKQFENNSIELLLPVSKTKQRKQKYILSLPVLDINYVLIRRINEPNIEKLSDLAGKKLALLEGWVISDYLKTHFPDIDFISYDNSQDALEAVAFGLVDGVVDDRLVALSLINNKMLSNLQIASKVHFDDLETSLHVMASIENKILIDIINQTINSLDKNEVRVCKK